MTDKLPPNLLALFAPRPPLRYLPPSDHAPEQRHTARITGVAAFLPKLREYKETDEYKPTESWQQRKDRIKQEKKQRLLHMQGEGIKDYQPTNDPKIVGDAFRTLFVARLSYDVNKQDLEREFGRFGPIERIRIVTNDLVDEKASKKKKNRGYAFIVFEHEQDMKAAYKETDGIRIKDRRVLVDVERGRTVAGWRPRRFGGGLGGRGYTKALPARPSGPGFGPPAGPGSFNRGGFRGGFQGGRGGFRGDFGGRGGFRGGFGGRGGVGYQSNGFGSGPGGAPDGAPAGPRGGRGGFGGGGGGGYGGGRPSFDERPPRGGGGSGSNREPVGPRGGYRDRDREGGFGGGGGGGGRDDYRKRPYDGDGYDDQRSKRRY